MFFFENVIFIDKNGVLKMKHINEIEVCELYKKDKSLRLIAKKMGCKSYGPIKRVLIKNGIALRKKGELRASGKLKINLDYFSNIDTHEKAYWLGVLTADGSITKDWCKVTLSSKDKELVRNFKRAISSEHKISRLVIYDKRTNKNYVRYSLQVGCKNFVLQLRQYGLKNRKSFCEEFPNINSDFIPDYIRGLFDGDGSICYLRKTGKMRINMIATENILSAVQDFLIKTLHLSKTKFSVVAEENENKICKMYINRNQDQLNFLRLIYKNSSTATRLSRKFNLAKK